MPVTDKEEVVPAFSPIAVVGLACRLPGARDPEEFWRLLEGAHSAIGAPSSARAGGDAELAGLIGGFLDRVDEFDAEFFGIAPREAAALDPQQRLLLELAWEASEDAGIPISRLRGGDTAVFAAAMAADYAALVQDAGPAAVTRHTLTGTSRAMLANRLSYTFGLRGPSLTVDSAQSSGLAAVHAACACLHSGDSATAFVAAANLNLTRAGALVAERFGGVSPSGRASVFDADADGYVRGEGAVVLLLKPLDRALADRDRVHAVIRSTALNNDGASPGLTVPTATAQAEVIERALRRARVRARDVHYVELHGTGTKVGDPIEAEALGLAFGRHRDPGDPLPVGSVKANIGHLEGAAGLAGLLKAILGVRHRRIPASLHHDRPDPAVDPAGRNLRVVTTGEAWPHPDRWPLAGVSSFGMGGTNAHVVVEAAPAPVDDDHPAVPRGALPFVLSAATPRALAARASQLAALVDEGPQPAAVASALVRDRAVLAQRAVVLAGDRETLVDRLRGLADGRVAPGIVRGTGAADGAIGVVFGGQGSQRVGAGSALYERFPVFRSAFDAAADALDRELVDTVTHSVREVAFGAPGTEGLLDSTVYTQSVIFALETALFRLIRSWGIDIAVVAGHSIGGIVAAHVAGALTTGEAARLVAARGRLMGSLPGGGAMLAIEAGEDEVRAAIGTATDVGVAAVNGPRAVVVSGDEAAVTAVGAALAAEGRRTKRLTVSHAFHSAHMDPVLAEFEEVVAGLDFGTPTGPVIVSDSTGAVLTATELADPAYWVRHLRGTVRFADAVRTARALGVTRFVELSADAVLTPMVGAALDHEPVAALSALRSRRDEVTTILSAAATLFADGIDVDWTAVVPRAARITLPTYPFQRRRHWITDSGGFSANGAAASEDDRESRGPEVSAAVLDSSAVVLGFDDVADIDPRRTFKELGLDSLGATELATALSKALGVTVAPTVVYDFPTPAALIDHLGRANSAENRAGAEVGPAGTTAPVEHSGADVTGAGSDLGITEQAAPTRTAGTAEQAAPTSTTGFAAGGAGAETADPIAIVAVSGRFPGGIESPERLWDLLAAGGDAIGDFPEDRGWDLDGLYDPTGARSGSSYARSGGFLREAGHFDAGFFGIAPREAAAMDPQQRVVLETSWELFERAGIVPDALAGSRTGVYIGATPQEYGPRLHQMSDTAEGYGLTGISPSVVSGRVAYTFGLAGPALTVDTACSSSLVALHLAVRALRAGETDLAVAGGVTVMANPGMFTEFSRQRGLSADGRCKAFAAEADGTGWSEAVSLVLLERLSDARRNGHEVLALVRGTAVNQDGASNGLTAPNGQAQQRVIRAALADAGVRPEDVDLVEAHGTGTALGDPIEAGALLATYGQRRAEPLRLGSLKSNIGHTQAAAGAAGVTKSVLALRNQRMPATLHAGTPSPHVDWSSGAVELLTEARPWPRSDRPRRAAVSSFGISGTNAHVILEEAPLPLERNTGTEPTRALASRRIDPPSSAGIDANSGVLPFVLSGTSQAALRAQARNLADHLAGGTFDPAAVASSLIRSRATFGVRGVVTAGDPSELLEGLGALASGRAAPSVTVGATTPVKGRVAVVFGGQGSQRAGAGQALYERFPVFRAAFDAATDLLDRHLAGVTEYPIREVAFGAQGTEGLIDSTVYTQSVVFALETALYRLVESWGVEIAVVSGHSIGGVVAAHVAGALPLESAARLVAARGRLMGSLPPGGAMVAVEATEAAVRELLARQDAGEVAIAAVNGPRSVVLSGTEAAVTRLAEEIRGAGGRIKRLPVSHAFHSPLMDPILADFERVAGDARFGATSVAVVSDATGQVTSAVELADPNYWVRHLRGTVRFADAVRTIRDSGAASILELGADAVLTPMAAATLEDHDPDGAAVCVPGLRAGHAEVASLLRAAAILFANGRSVDWAAVVPPAARVELPTYAFQRARYWLEPETVRAAAPGQDGWFWERVRDRDADALAAELGVPADRLPDLLPALDAWHDRNARSARLDSWTHRLTWRSHRPTGATLRPGERWLLVLPADGSADPWAEAIGRALERAGAVADTLCVDVAAEAFPEPPNGFRDHTKVLSLLSLTPRSADSADVPVTATAVARAFGGGGADYWTLTSGAVAVTRTETVRAPEQHWHWSFAAAAAAEGAVRTGGLVDLPREPADGPAAQVVDLVAAPGGEREFAVRDLEIRVRRLTPAEPRRRAPSAWRPTGTVLITGGTGALGARVARRLAHNGVRDLLLVSRRGADAPGAAELVAELTALGARPVAAACDIGDRAAVADLLAGIPADRPLTDVVHTAAVLDDAVVDDLDADRLRRVHRVKVDGARHLHELTADRALASFVLFSSVTGTLTAPGQANYGPGNAYLDALARHRRGLGLPATSLAWGHWDGGGIAGAGTELRRSGLRPMDPELALDALERALGDDETHAVIADVDWSVAARGVHAALLSELVVPEQRAEAVEPGLLERVSGLDPAATRRHVAGLVRAEVAAALGYGSPETVADERSLRDQGLTSLSAVELRNRLREVTALDLPATVVFDHPTVVDLTDLLVAEVASGAPGALDGLLSELDRAAATLADPSVPAPDRALVEERLRRLLDPPRAAAEAPPAPELSIGSDEDLIDFIGSELGIS